MRTRLALPGGLTLMVTCFAFCAPIFGQTTMVGGRGMLRVQAAETAQAKAFVINSFFSTFSRNTRGGRLYDHSLSGSFTYGLSNNVELTTQVIPYQDDQVHSSWGPPGDILFGAKWRTPLSGRMLRTAVRTFLRLPTSSNHNVPFEPFSSNDVSWGVMAISSLLVSAPLPFKVSANLGYVDHDIGTFLQSRSTDQLLLGLGFKIPIRDIIFYTEYSAEIFHNNSAINFSNNSMRLSHGVKLRTPYHTVLDLGFDIGFSQDLSRYPAPLHEYADWKVFSGLSYQFRASKMWKDRKTERATPEKLAPEEVDGALERLREKREKIDEALDDMRKDLDDKSERDEE